MGINSLNGRRGRDFRLHSLRFPHHCRHTNPTIFLKLIFDNGVSPTIIVRDHNFITQFSLFCIYFICKILKISLSYTVHFHISLQINISNTAIIKALFHPSRKLQARREASITHASSDMIV